MAASIGAVSFNLIGKKMREISMKEAEKVSGGISFLVILAVALVLDYLGADVEVTGGGPVNGW